MTQLERIADTHTETGEGPLWHPDERRLYWVDIPEGRLFRYDPASDEYEIAYERDGAIGGATVQADGSLLLFEEAGRIERWTDRGPEPVVESIDGEEDSRFNDVIADPRGRVFCGTMPTEDRPGRLYRLGTDGSLAELRDDVALPNGLGFAPDREHLYFTESEANRILRYAYDEETGAIADPEPFVEGGAGVPDGMTVDAAGYVWSARWDGGRLVRYDPNGEEVDRVEFPARKVSSVAFGGLSYSAAYVTTALAPASAGGEPSPGEREREGGGAGALFRVDLGVRGTPEFYSRVGLE